MKIGAKIRTGDGILNENSEIIFGLNFNIPFSLTAKDSDVLVTSGPVEEDLSSLKQVADIVKKAELKFKIWNNTTGLNIRVKLKKGSSEILSTDISTSNPVISLTQAQLKTLSDGGVNYEIWVPKDQNLSLNYSGLLQLAPYIAVELNVATEVKLK